MCSVVSLNSSFCNYWNVLDNGARRPQRVTNSRLSTDCSFLNEMYFVDLFSVPLRGVCIDSNLIVRDLRVKEKEMSDT